MTVGTWVTVFCFPIMVYIIADYRLWKFHGYRSISLTFTNNLNYLVEKKSRSSRFQFSTCDALITLNILITCLQFCFLYMVAYSNEYRLWTIHRNRIISVTFTISLNWKQSFGIHPFGSSADNLGYSGCPRKK